MLSVWCCAGTQARPLAVHAVLPACPGAWVLHTALLCVADSPRRVAGNWATDLSAGSEFGYMLLFAVLVSSMAAMFLQYLSLKLGVVCERDLAQGCRDAYPR